MTTAFMSTMCCVNCLGSYTPHSSTIKQRGKQRNPDFAWLCRRKSKVSCVQLLFLAAPYGIHRQQAAAEKVLWLGTTASLYTKVPCARPSTPVISFILSLKYRMANTMPQRTTIKEAIAIFCLCVTYRTYTSCTAE